ncbi:MAG: AAA family ATPase [Planctomycetes bacterium]|nr:AAA family ATPase [Planctomycetota bacterium]HPY75325.1 AAA family ATPase [Planctomycetota bacterium]HQA99718.1 AAA family ATPase [Planctomycetota bacterium]
MGNLFTSLNKNFEPLAARLRPESLDDFFGQEHIIGKGRLLRRSIEADQLSSVLFYGPPGTGKTTLAKIIANTTKANYQSLNAVLAGVAELRKAIAMAKEQKEIYDTRTILFIDEVHRWNKAQQDALLPWVENGTITLIGATTENPYFEVIKPLVSRSRIFQLKSLEAEDLEQILHRALQDKKKGLGNYNAIVTEEAKNHLIQMSNGDARSLLNALELAVITTPPDEDNKIIVTLQVAEESIQKKAVLYDKEGDVHYDTISAFIKSLRGSDPDAALYWLARMVYAGESPRFLFRRMLIFAAEDVGLADPNAMVITQACANAFEYVGLPEGRFHLAEAALYLSTAPKSNSSMAFFDALKTVEQEMEAQVPNHLKDASRDAESFGHGEGYMYPHAYKDHWVAQQYLPDFLQGRTFYSPTEQGYEKNIAYEVARKREEQLTAMLESILPGQQEIMTYSGKHVQAEREKWLSRTMAQTGKSIGQQRDRVLQNAKLQRNSLVLDLHAATGLLSWEVLRMSPEGGLSIWEENKQLAQGLQQQIQRMPIQEQPILYTDNWQITLATLLQNNIKFDAIIARNAFLSSWNMIQDLPTLLSEKGVISIVETIPNKTQRLYNLFTPEQLPYFQQLQEAEESIYKDSTNPSLQVTPEDILQQFQKTNLNHIQQQTVQQTTTVYVTQTILTQWFSTNQNTHGVQKTYYDHISPFLTEDQIQHLYDQFKLCFLQKNIPWEYTVTYIYSDIALKNKKKKKENE